MSELEDAIARHRRRVAEDRESMRLWNTEEGGGYSELPQWADLDLILAAAERTAEAVDRQERAELMLHTVVAKRIDESFAVDRANRRAEAAEAKRDALRAVIAKALATRYDFDWTLYSTEGAGMCPDEWTTEYMRRILSAVPTGEEANA